MAKEINELECECGYIAGAPATLRIHQGTHKPDDIDLAIDKTTEVVERVKRTYTKRKK